MELGEMSTQPHLTEAEVEAPLMDFDGLSPLGEFFSSYPMSPLVLSSPDHSLSPFWVFPDYDDDCFFTRKNHIDCSRRSLTLFKLVIADDPVSPPNCGQDYPDQSCMIKDRMTEALRKFKASMEQHILAQVWVPVKNGDQYVLTTSGQPFVLDAHNNELHQYRMVSLMYTFSVDDENDLDDLPARVFRQKLPEWTPNVQYYSSKEYQRLNHALNYNVRGSLALPVFEHSSMSCIGVIEVILTSQKINFGPEVDKVCKALEEVNLKSIEILNHPNTLQICHKGHQNALAEILEILTVVCETHKIPLAQTWIPCRHRRVLAHGGGFKKSCSSFDGSCDGQVCMSAEDVAFYVVDAHMWGFREACVEHHLQKGQGVVGQAFESRNSCFCEDISQFCKTEYPLVHYAKMFGLTSSFAICLESSHSENVDYILEFFLPPYFIGNRDMNTLKDLLSVTMREHSQSLKFASGKELLEEVACIGMNEDTAKSFYKPSNGEPMRIPSSFQANVAPIQTIKVAYENCTIRFSLSSTAGIIELKNEVAKRLKLKMESFNLKYRDDDQELILIACDADLLECFRILKSLGNTAIRLLVEPIAK